MAASQHAVSENRFVIRSEKINLVQKISWKKSIPRSKRKNISCQKISWEEKHPPREEETPSQTIRQTIRQMNTKPA